MPTQKQISGAINAANAGDPHLGRLSDLHDFKVADGYPDIRGWKVQVPDGTKVGKVDDLIVDTDAMRARYLNVKLDRSVVRDAKDAGLDADGRHVLLPIGGVALDERADHVVTNGYTLAQIAMLPVYDGTVITGAYEASLRDALGGGTAVKAVAVMDPATGAGVAAVAERTTSYDHPAYDDQRLYAARRPQNARPNADGTQRITLAEEQLAVGKRQVSGGEVDVRKTVDTRHVQEQVAVTHEEVTMERRPITDASQLGAESIGEGEIRIPLMQEQLVVEKRTVPIEQIIVRKTQVTDPQLVEADLRKERLVTEGLASDANVAGAAR